MLFLLLLFLRLELLPSSNWRLYHQSLIVHFQKKVKASTDTNDSICYSSLYTKSTNQQVQPTVFSHTSPGIVSPVRNVANDRSADHSILQLWKRLSARNLLSNNSSLSTPSKVLLAAPGVSKQGAYIPPERPSAERNAYQTLLKQSTSVPSVLSIPIDFSKLGYDECGSAEGDTIRKRAIKLPFITVAPMKAGGTPSKDTDAEMPVWDEDADSTRNKPRNYSYHKRTPFSNASIHTHVVLFRIFVMLLRLEKNNSNLVNGNYQKLKFKYTIWQAVQF